MALSPAAHAETIGRYHVLRPLAKGGMAEILLARSIGAEGFERLIALKRILPQLAHELEFVKMFLDEARIAATLHHPNIVQVFDVLEAGDSFVIAMEYLHGADLGHIVEAARVRGAPIPLELVIHIVSEVCAGLHYAHERKSPDGAPLDIVHRDVSPQNILVTYEGAVKLVDFGIAKATQRLTTTAHSSLKGKLPYMSPEQCRSRPLDRRTDVFSLAVVMWELLAQRRLYRGDSDYEILKAIVEHDAPSPASDLAPIPPELEQIVMRALRRDRDDRYATALELQLALEQFAQTRGLVVTARRLAEYLRETVGEIAVPSERGLATDALTMSETTVARVAPVRPLRSTHTGNLHEATESLPAAGRISAPPRRRWLVGLALAALVAGAVAAVTLLRSDDRAAPSMPAVAPTAVSPIDPFTANAPADAAVATSPEMPSPANPERPRKRRTHVERSAPPVERSAPPVERRETRPELDRLIPTQP